MPRFSLRSGVLLFAVLSLSFLTLKTLQPQNQLLAAPKMNLIRAPEFPANADWLNTDKPLSMRALKGKIVLLDFWTYACINCMQILPDLKKLERKYPNELVIIGVHSAKFENEGETKNIRNAILRYKIEHPVLNDKTMRVWEEYAVRGWPTLTLVDPNGRIVRQESGEGQYEELDAAIGKLVRESKVRGELNSTPLQFALEAAKTQKTDLSFPGKVLASGNQLFVADSNHNRIVVSDLEGNVSAVAGSGEIGLKDGDFKTATFHNPQGMALSADGNTLYVADTDNHAIRALDLQSQKVTTIAGTGKQAEYRKWGGVGTQAALASPWDVLRVGSTLYVAMAGTHQIWAMDLNTKAIAPYAGSGAEARFDASLKEAALAQPSGLATNGKVLFFADSESSSIRTVSLPGNGDKVSTLVGGDPNPRNLFAFGDKDGKGFAAKLQHPLGVSYNGDYPQMLYIADTYNHKIKTLHVPDGTVDTFPLDMKFNEPGGLSLDGGKLFVADTNNHQIRVVDLAAKTVADLKFKNLPAPLPAEPQRIAAMDASGVLQTPLTTLSPNSRGELIFDVKLPRGYHLNREAPQKWNARVEGMGLSLPTVSFKNNAFQLPLRVKYAADTGGASGVLVVASDVYYCTDDQGICKVKLLKVRAPFTISDGGAKTWKISAQIGEDDEVSLINQEK